MAWRRRGRTSLMCRCWRAGTRCSGTATSQRSRRPSANSFGGCSPCSRLAWGGGARGGTVRRMLHEGGEASLLARRARRRKPRRLVLLIDVSGSMEPYADALLRFAHVAARRRTGTEVFTIGTRLTRISRELRRRDPDLALAAVAKAIPDWSGGTRLGELLRAFLDRWGQRGTARGAVVVVASDGWERGDASQLGDQMARLAR